MQNYYDVLKHRWEIVKLKDITDKNLCYKIKMASNKHGGKPLLSNES